jgi:hypothetical protein
MGEEKIPKFMPQAPSFIPPAPIMPPKHVPPPPPPPPTFLPPMPQFPTIQAPPAAPPTFLMPMPPMMPPMISPCDLFMMVRPVVKHGCKELGKCGPKHTLTEVAMIGYLMGTGMDYRSALMLVESWEVNEMFVFRDE